LAGIVAAFLVLLAQAVTLQEETAAHAGGVAAAFRNVPHVPPRHHSRALNEYGVFAGGFGGIVGAFWWIFGRFSAISGAL